MRTIITLAASALFVSSTRGALEVQSTAAASLFNKVGSLEVGTYENTVFYWGGSMYILENIACTYWGHAGLWQPSIWGNHSYARIRDLTTGQVLVNITATLQAAFITPFTDYDTNTLWLFGTPTDRCHTNGHATAVWAWWVPAGAEFAQDTAWQGPVKVLDTGGQRTYNVQVTKVGPLGGSSAATASQWHAQQANRKAVLQEQGKHTLPPHNYAMMFECFGFAINNRTDGNLTTGWSILPNTAPPSKAPCGGPCMYYNPADAFYYILTGGQQVFLYRTQDFSTWQESNPSPFLAPSAEDALIAPYADFASRAGQVGTPTPLYVGVPDSGLPFRPYAPYWMGTNWTSWVWNNNDADMCCMHSDVKQAYVIWGASTQGGPPHPPLNGKDAGTNSLGISSMALPDMLSAYFASDAE